jgi:hypothetical protein
MTIEEQVLERLRALSPDKQREVLDFVDTIANGENAGKPLPNLRGIWKKFNIDISEEDIAEARREIWGTFPEVQNLRLFEPL